MLYIDMLSTLEQIATLPKFAANNGRITYVRLGGAIDRRAAFLLELVANDDQTKDNKDELPAKTENTP